MDSLLPLVDLTYLKHDRDEALAFIEKANDLEPAALCLSPEFVRLGTALSQHPIATVCNFPSGNGGTDAVLEEIRQALEGGAVELDIVLPFEMILSGESKQAFERLAAWLAIIPPHIVTKVIVETSEFHDPNQLTAVCQQLIELKIDFIKTSTGKKQGAEIDKSQVILEAIRDFDDNAQVGFKASGGIRTLTQAQGFYQLACEILNQPLTSKRFRIGASQLT